MAVPLVPTLVAIVALLGCSAFFSSSETALLWLSREWLAEAAQTDRRAAAVADVLEDPHRLLGRSSWATTSSPSHCRAS